MLKFYPLLLNRLKSIDIQRFLYCSVFIMALLTAFKIYELYSGLPPSIIVDTEYFIAGEEYKFRISNALIFGQRNLAGGVVGGLSVLLALLEVLTKERYNSIWAVLFLITFNTLSNTGLLIFFISFIFSRPKAFYLLLLVSLSLPFLIADRLDLAVESLTLKVWTIFSYFENLDLIVLLFGGGEQSLWIEFALLDLFNDLGFFGVFMLGSITFVSGLLTSFSKLWIFNSITFYLMFIFSNSTLNPPVFLIYIMCMCLISNEKKLRNAM